MDNLIIVGGGNSVPAHEHLFARCLQASQINKKADIWALNRAFFELPVLADALLWLDLTFFYENYQSIYDLQNTTELISRKQAIHDTVKISQYDVSDIPEDNKIYCGAKKLAGIFALSLAISRGYKNIYLLGYDYCQINNQLNWYKNTNTNDIYTKYDANKQFLTFVREDVKIYNVSPQSRIDCFEKLTYEQFYKKIGE